MVRLFVILFDAHPCFYGGVNCSSFRAANGDVEFEVIDVVRGGGGGGGGGGPPGTIPPYLLFSTNN